MPDDVVFDEADAVRVLTNNFLPRPQAENVATYLAGLLEDFFEPDEAPGETTAALDQIVDGVLDLLCSRRFTHLSRSQSLPYRTAIRPLIRRNVIAGRPLRFDYDLGPGYHASVHEDFKGLCFLPGLGELLALRQIRLFSRAVKAIYKTGVYFQLVIDDLCAWVTNDVSLRKTRSYLDRLDVLITAVGMCSEVSVLAESDIISSALYMKMFEQQTHVSPFGRASPSEINNVSRFLGRACSEALAAVHIARYQRAILASERVLANHLHGVRLTQRATQNSLGFRSFPGGDARIQTGEVALFQGAQNIPRPVLVTCNQYSKYQCWRVGMADLPEIWPQAIGPIYVVAELSSTPTA